MSPILVNAITGAVALAALALVHFGIIPGDVGYTIAGGSLYYLTGQTYNFAARSALKGFAIDARTSGALGAHLTVSTGDTNSSDTYATLPLIGGVAERPSAQGAGTEGPEKPAS